MAHDGSLIFDTAIDIASFQKQASSLSSIAGKAGKAVAGAFTAAAAGIGAAIKVGMDFEASMSQVAATMGMTADEIAAGSAEYEKLSKAAQEAGATTKYSASEAAEALNYLALAGYDATKAAEVLPSVLNLAAAGGMELAYASDLATDAMAALGIEATSENLTHFGDELSKTAQKSNTSVSQLGEAILVCAGTAKNSGQSLETLNTALGVMANRGIKGSEGGTHLRNVLLSLTAGTDQAKKALTKLGVTVADSEGNIRSLDDILADLKESLSGMNEEAKINKLSEIFNKTDISAINALLDGMGDEWSNLKKEISTADGAMADMAETMNDNLKGRMDELSSALEALGIAVYSGMEQPLKEAVESATDNVSRLASSLTDGELSGALENIGTLLGAFANTLSSVLGIALKGIITLLSALGSQIEIVTGVVAGAVAAFAAFKTITFVSSMIGNLKDAFEDLYLLLLCHPYLVAATAIIGLGVAIGTAAKSAHDAYKETEEYKRSNEGLKETIDDAKESIEKLNKERNKKVTENLYDVEKVQQYADELSRLADKNGKVTDSDAERARFLLGELNSALGTEYSMQGNIIGQYQQMQSEIDALIQKKRAMTILDTMEEGYSEAVKKQTELLSTYNTAYNQLMTKEQELQRFREESGARIAELQAMNDGEGPVGGQERAELDVLKTKLIGLEAQYEKYQQTATEAYNNVLENSKTVTEYETLAAAIQSGKYEEITKAINNWKAASILANDEVTGDTASKLSSMETEITESLSGITGIIQKYGKDSSAAHKESYNDAVSSLSGMVTTYKEAGGDLRALVPIFEAAGIDAGKFFSEGIVESIDTGTVAAQDSATNAGTKIADKTRLALEAGKGPIKHAMSTLMSNTTQGITDETPTITDAATGVVTTAATGAGETASTEGNTVGAHLGDGIVEGIASKNAAAYAAGATITDNAIQGAKDAGVIKSPSRKMRDEVGAMLVEGMYVGIKSRIDKVPEAFENLMEDIKLQLDLGAITEADYYKKIEEYRDEYLTKGSDEWWKYTKDIIEYEEKLTEEQKDREFKRLENLKSLRIVSEKEYYVALEELRDKYLTKGSAEWEEYTLDIAQYYSDAFNDIIESVSEKQADLKDKLIDGLQFTQTVTAPIVKNGEVLWDVTADFTTLTDLQPYIDDMKLYTSALEDLKNREGMSSDLMAKIVDMDLKEGYGLANQLLGLSDADFKKYIGQYEEYISEAEKLSSDYYADEKEMIIEAADGFAESFKNSLGTNLSNVDDIMAQIGYDGASAFAREFKLQLAEMMGEVADTVLSVNAISSAAGNNQYNTYNISGNNETTSQQLKACANQAKIEQLRGGYS